MSKGKLFVIHSDGNVRQEAIGRFIKEGYEIYEASNANEAQDNILNIMPDVIMLELGLLDGDAMVFNKISNELVKFLRSNENTEDIMFCFMVNGVRPEPKMSDAGIDTSDDFVYVPFDIEELFLKIVNLIRIHKKFLELKGHNKS